MAAAKSQSCSPRALMPCQSYLQSWTGKMCSRKAFFGQIHAVFHGVSECSLSTSLPCSQGALVLVAGSIQVVIILKAGSLLCLFLLPGGSEVSTVSASDHENVEIRPDGPGAAFQQEVWINALLLEKRLLTTALWGVCSIPWVVTSAPSQEILLQAREEGSEIAEVLTPGLPNRNRSGWGCLAYCFIW